MSALRKNPGFLIGRVLKTRIFRLNADNLIDFENSLPARRLRDKGIREVAEKFAKQNRIAAEERQKVIEHHKVELAERTRSAKENKKLREEKEERRLCK